MVTSFETFAHNLGQKFEPEVRYHLARVYACLGSTTAFAAVGSALHLSGYFEAGILSVIGSIAICLALNFIKDDGKNFYTRLGLLLGFGFFSGQTLGPLLKYVAYLNPAIIVTALIGTMVVFVSLSLSALLAEHGKYLFLGGLLVSVLNTMALLSILNLFMHSYIIQQSHLYIGLASMAAFVVYDTQAIIEKCRLGNRDCIQHSLDLFFDVIGMFRRLLIILTQKEERSRENKKKN